MSDKKKLRVPDYVYHTIEAIGRIENYVKDIELRSFVDKTLVHDAVVRNLEIIGEAANNIKIPDSAFAEHHGELQLDVAYQMRNALVHGFYNVNLLTVWNPIQKGLPNFKQQMTDIETALSVRSDSRIKAIMLGDYPLEACS